MTTHTRPSTPDGGLGQAILSQIESRAWRLPSQLRIRNPNRIPAPIYTHIRFPAGGVSSQGRKSRPMPTHARPSTPVRRSCEGRNLAPHPLMPSRSDHHPQSAQGPLTPRLSKGEPGGEAGGAFPRAWELSSRHHPRAPLPYLGFVSHIPSAGFVSYLRPGDSNPQLRHNSKLAPRSKAHSIDAIPSCADFTAHQLPNLRRVAPGTEEPEKTRNTIQINSNPTPQALAVTQ